MKKDKVNARLYKAHLHAAHEWGNCWNMIQDHMQNTLNRKLTDVYRNLNKKLNQLTHGRTDTISGKQKFFHGVTNLSNINFTEDETSMLNKGLKYNLGHKHSNWVQNLSLEAECAITLLPHNEQDYMRHRVAKQIDKIYTQLPARSTYTPKQAKELQITKPIKDKLRNNNATITKADKGNSIVISYLNSYAEKVSNFIHKNGASEAKTNTTVKFQKELKHTLKLCKTVINNEDKWKLTNLNPQTPNLRGLIKIHKEDTPIRPVVNYTQAPAYKLAKKLSNILETYVPLPYVYNVQNSIHLMKDISDIPVTPGLKLASLDISDIYSNVPTNELENIVQILCQQQNIDTTLTQEILTITNTVISQNY